MIRPPAARRHPLLLAGAGRSLTTIAAQVELARRAVGSFRSSRSVNFYSPLKIYIYFLLVNENTYVQVLSLKIITKTPLNDSTAHDYRRRTCTPSWSSRHRRAAAHSASRLFCTSCATSASTPAGIAMGGRVIKCQRPSARAQSQLCANVYIPLSTCRWRWARADSTARG